MKLVRSPYLALRLPRPDRRDTLLAAALLGVGTFEAVLTVARERPAALALVPALVLPLAYRRDRPAAVALAVTAALAVQGLFEEVALFEQTFTGYVCVLVAGYSLGRHARRRSVIVVGAGCALTIAATIGVADASIVSGIFAAGFTIAPVAGGRVVRDRTRLVNVLERQARELEDGRRLQAQAAACRERDRVSRELHDIVSHSVSEMVIGAHAARLLVTRDPQRAPAAIEVVEIAGRGALEEMRRLLGVLRRGDEALALAPSPSLARLGALIDRTRMEGRSVDLVVENEPLRLPPGVDVAAYRIIEQALSKPTPGGVGVTRVRVRYRRRMLELDVLESGVSGASAGGQAARSSPAVGDAGEGWLSTVGIRERVAAFGGDVQAAVSDDGGRVLRARLPLTGQPAVPAPPASRDGGSVAGAEAGTSGSHVRRRGLRPIGLRRRHAGALLVLALTAVVGLEVATTPAREGPPLTNALTSVFVTVPLLLRRSFPLSALAVSWTAASLMCALLTPVSAVVSLFLVMMLYPYACAAHASTRAAWVGLALALGGVIVIDVLQRTLAWGDIVFPAILVALSWLVGRMVRSRADMAREVAERAQRLEQTRDEHDAATAASERRRIARELHDVVSHTLSVMVVQAGGARWTLERHPDRAAGALDVVEETGRDALAELRRLLGMFELDEQAPTLVPQPGMGQIQDLVEQMRSAGLTIELKVVGEPRTMSAGLQLTAYRIVQEALTNALRHAAPASACVIVRYATSSLVLQISNEGRGTRYERGDEQPGHGIAGMRERVAVHEGELFAGPQRGGGFLVWAQLPLVTLLPAQEVRTKERA